jgi:recombination protein RecT
MTTTNQSIQRNGAQDRSLQSLLTKMVPEIARALPKHVSPDRMARIALTALRSTPKLAECTPESFLGSVIQASQLGLEVNTPLGQAYLIPFEDRRNNRTLCQLIVGYQGFMDLARRSGSVRAIYAYPVYQGDTFAYELGLEPTVKHTPGTGPRDPKLLTHVYAVAKLADGEPVFTVLTIAEVERYRDRSRAKNNGPWVTDYEAMALKTAIRRLFRWLPKSAEMAVASAVDEALDSGRNQLGTADPEVIALLQSNGVEVDTADAEEVEQSTEVAAKTEELVEKHRASAKAAKAAERQPGEDG